MKEGRRDQQRGPSCLGVSFLASRAPLARSGAHEGGGEGWGLTGGDLVSVLGNYDLTILRMAFQTERTAGGTFPYCSQAVRKGALRTLRAQVRMT